MTKSSDKTDKDKKSPECSFCGRTIDHVRKMISGSSNVHICDECIDLCNEIIAEEVEQDQRLHFDACKYLLGKSRGNNTIMQQKLFFVRRW